MERRSVFAERALLPEITVRVLLLLDKSRCASIFTEFDSTVIYPESTSGFGHPSGDALFRLRSIRPMHTVLTGVIREHSLTE